MNKKRGQKAQITIFVIIAMILVTSVALVFVLVKQPLSKITPVDDPKAYIETCVQDSVEEAIELIILHGGYTAAPSLSIEYKTVEIAYLCHTDANVEICTNKEPMLISRMEQEIYDYINLRVESCFDNLEEGLKNYNYDAGPTSYEVEILPKKVLIKIDKEITYTKNERVSTLSTFDSVIASPLYDFGSLTGRIINEEVDCDCGIEACNADIIQLSRFNNDFEVERFVTSRNEKIYTIKDVITGDVFNFGIRNCVRLPHDN